MKQFLKALWCELLQHAYMWMAIVASLFGAWTLAFPLVMLAFYDKLDSILKEIRDRSTTVTVERIVFDKSSGVIAQDERDIVFAKKEA
ncbi:MAG: hypothetical protein FWF12_00055 [Betaproteobacteria bacterium]|nr:hypothetical protein [Betaproteobacteria bacterium]